MSEQKFQVGDVVQLKSGGQVMTVVAKPNTEMEAKCEWFLGGELRTCLINAEALKVTKVLESTDPPAKSGESG